MIDPNKLMRSVFLALALLFTAPLLGVGGAMLGASAVQAQNAVIASVLFEGNQRFSDDQLLAMVGIATTGIYSEQAVQTDVESIRIAYDQAGYNNVTVSARPETLPNGRIRVTYVVNEGQRSGIAAINFTGNNSINSGTLKSQLLTKETSILSFLFRDDVYDEQKVAVDRERVRLYYANHGFPDTQVTSVSEFDQSRNAYFINFTVNEGQRYEFGDVGIETSINGLNSDALRSTIETREGQGYSFEDLQKTVEDMAFAATGQGYAFADVRPRIDRDPASGTFNVTYLVDEGPRVYVERINITGNDKTRDYVIRRELPFGEGDPFNRSLVTRGKANIERLGYFSAVDVSAAQGSSADQVVINIAVTEQSTGDYGLTAGYSTQDGILGEVSLTERNFLGRGQYLRIAVGATQTGKTFDFSFTEPRFMGLRVSSGVDIFHRVQDESSSLYYGTTSTGGQLRFGLPVTDQLTATVFGGFNRTSVTDAALPTSSLVVDGETFNKAFVGYTLTYNDLDSVERPREGLYATFTQQYVGYDFNYLKSEARARYFMPVIEDSGIVASVRGQAGIINNLDNGEIRSIEAFPLGSTLIRGFEGRGIGPRLTTGESLGATMYAGLSAELEFPIPVLPESYGLRGALFADAAWVGGVPNLGSGTLSAGSVDSPLRASVGASIIWESPFGPLRGDFAQVINKSTDDRTQMFQFTISSLL